MASEKLTFQGASGQQLAGRLEMPDGEPWAYAVFAHCFACSKNSLAAVRISRGLAARGIAALRFDFTGLGESEGEFGQNPFRADVADLAAAAQFLAREKEPPKLLVGHSLGGAAVLAAAHELPEVKAVAVIGAPFEVEHVTQLFEAELDEIKAQGSAPVQLGELQFEVSRAFIEDLSRHDQEQRIEALDRALLVLHAPMDAVVGIENAQAIFLAAKHPKSFVSLDTADHLLTDAADADYAAGIIAAWASRYVEPRREGA